MRKNHVDPTRADGFSSHPDAPPAVVPCDQNAGGLGLQFCANVFGVARCNPERAVTRASSFWVVLPQAEQQTRLGWLGVLGEGGKKCARDAEGCRKVSFFHMV